VDKPDLIDMFFKETAVKREDTAASIISDMTPKEFIEVIITFLQELGKSAAHEAFDLIDKEPNERERVKQLVKMAHRCASVEAIMERLGDDSRLYEPSSHALEHSVTKAYNIVATHKRLQGER
jgi:glutamine synthetase type III